MREDGGGDHATVGMRKPSGEYERPIPGTRLFWTKPGNFTMCSYFTKEHRICHCSEKNRKNLVSHEYKCLTAS